MPTIGQKLGETRREKGLTVNDVAHVTRIHPNMILNIEEDDFSKFPSVAYAKSFLRKYSDYLGVDLSTSMDHLNSGTTVRLSDNELMGEMKKTIKKDSLFRLERRPKGFRRRSEKPGGAPLFLNFILLALILALAIFYFLGYNASSIDEAKSDIATGLNSAIPFAGTAEPTKDLPSPVSAPAAAATPAPVATPPAAPAQNPSVATTTPAPVAPGTTPQYPVIKEAVTPPRDENLPAAIPENPLRPRNTPRMVFAEEPVKPLSAGELPLTGKPTVEPQAALRPEGTDPAAAGTTNPASTPAPASTSGSNPAGDTPPAPAPAPAPASQPIRAVPVAASEQSPRP